MFIAIDRQRGNWKSIGKEGKHVDIARGRLEIASVIYLQDDRGMNSEMEHTKHK